MKEKKILRIKKYIIFTYDTAITNGQVHHWGVKIKIYMYMIYF